MQGHSDGVMFEELLSELQPVSGPDSYVTWDESSPCHHMVTCFPFFQLWAPAEPFAEPLAFPAFFCEVLFSPKLLQTQDWMDIFLGAADFSPEPGRLLPSQTIPSLPAKLRDGLSLLCHFGDGDFSLSMLCNLIVLCCH